MEVYFKRLCIFSWLLAIILILFAEVKGEYTVSYGGVNYIVPKNKEEIVVPPDAPETYTVVKGDTLWSIAGKILKDPFLWPFIWEANKETIPNPHKIKPGQKIVIPGGKAVEKEAPPAMAEEKEKLPEETPAEETPSPEKVGLTKEELEKLRAEELMPLVGYPKPVVSSADMDSAGYIEDELSYSYTIIGSEEEFFTIGKDDIVYMDGGLKDGIKQNEAFYVINAGRSVFHPVSKRKIGVQVVVKGIIEVICVQEKTSTAVVRSCFQEPIIVGDKLIPYSPLPVPVSAIKPLDKCLIPPKDLTGYIVEVRGGEMGVSEGYQIFENDIVYLDRGAIDGIGPGDHFLVYREAKSGFEQVPDTIVGELCVLRTTDKTATAVVTQCSAALQIGDRITLIK